jgi:hypothetical protein
MTSEKPSQLVEFRNYRIRAGATDPFIEHFERHLLESQEALGMEIIGQFRLLDDPDRFAWIRRFRSPLSRAEALENFYGGPVWKEFGPRANELMVEYTDVHLLVPDRSAPAFGADHVPHGRRDREPTRSRSIVVAALYEIEQAGRIPPHLVEAFETAAIQGPVSELGRLVTAPVANEFPRLPVHESHPVALWLLSEEGDGRNSSSIAQEIANAH